MWWHLWLCFLSNNRFLFFYPIDLEAANFWNWTNFADYLQFILLFVTVGGLLTYLLLDVTVYLEGLGFVSVFTEAMLGAPQFYRNFSNKSTEGMRYELIFFDYLTHRLLFTTSTEPPFYK